MTAAQTSAALTPAQRNAAQRAAIAATDATLITGYQVGGRDTAERRATSYRLAANVEALADARWVVCVTPREGFVWIESATESKADAWQRNNVIAAAVKATASGVSL